MPNDTPSTREPVAPRTLATDLDARGMDDIRKWLNMPDAHGLDISTVLRARLTAAERERDEAKQLNAELAGGLITAHNAESEARIFALEQARAAAACERDEARARLTYWYEADGTVTTHDPDVIVERRKAAARALTQNATLAEQVRTLKSALESLLPGLVLDLRHADPDDDMDAMRSRVQTVRSALSATAPAQEGESRG